MVAQPTEYRVRFPQPYPLQAEFINSPAKRRVVCAGRRAGKTEGCGILAAKTALAGKKVLITSTSQDQSDLFWKKLTKWFKPLIQAGLIKKNEVKRTLEFHDALARGGYIKVKTGRDPDLLRGEDADLIIFDECAFLDPSAWYEVGAPMLADRDGTAVFISTPKRRNWFYHLHTKAKIKQAEGDPRWAAWHFSTLNNPYLNKNALAELIEDMSADAYKQEILAEFLEGQGQVFKNVRDLATALRQSGALDNHEYVAGIDLAKQHDYTVITIIDKSLAPWSVVDRLRFNKKMWPEQVTDIRDFCLRYKVRSVNVDATGVGDPIADLLARELSPYRIGVNSFVISGTSKPQLVEGLGLAFERKEIALLQEDEVFIGELESFERKMSERTGHSQYSAPEGLHDDCVMSLALAWETAKNYRPGGGIHFI